MNKKTLRTRVEMLMQEEVFSSALEALPARERRKRFPPFSTPRYAMRVVCRLEDRIETICQREEIPSSAVKAILFREVLGFGFEDLLDGLLPNTSRGLCQIRPTTARKADEALRLPTLSLSDYRRKLMNTDTNLTYCARILKAEMLLYTANTDQCGDDVWQAVFLKYNGSKQYAHNVLGYLHAFEKHPVVNNT